MDALNLKKKIRKSSFVKFLFQVLDDALLIARTERDALRQRASQERGRQGAEVQDVTVETEMWDGKPLPQGTSEIIEMGAEMTGYLIN